jgi:cold shock CspA family protein
MVMAAAKKHKPQRADGVLVFWNADRGFGYARRDHGVGEVFVSGKAVRYSGIDEADLQVGMRLSFSLHPDANGRAPWATNIEIQR